MWIDFHLAVRFIAVHPNHSLATYFREKGREKLFSNHGN